MRVGAVVLAVLRRSAQIRAAALAAAAACALGCLNSPSQAADFGDIDGFDIRWDNTLRETLGVRLDDPDAALLANINADDGDRAFRPGLMTARLDVYSELTAVRGDFGADFSVQGWYDPVYHAGTANDSPQTFNDFDVPYDQFPKDTRRLMGGEAEIANAFLSDSFSLAGLPTTVRIGRQTVLWGESLFFASNGIAAGQAPIDDIQALGNPLAKARDLYLPVGQAYVRVQLGSGFALEAYDQFEWRRDRLPGVASYFSTTDILDAGGGWVLLPGGGALHRTSDDTPQGFGQFGVALRLQTDDADFGLYALRYDAKLPQPEFTPEYQAYNVAFPKDIALFGASASTYLGTANIAGEISVRLHTPLIPSAVALPGGATGGGGGPIYAAALAIIPQIAPPPPPPPAFQGYATGDTWHAQGSIVAELPPAQFWQDASIEAEAAMNDLLAVTEGNAYVQVHRTHFAASLEAVFTPRWFQVLPGLDVSAPLGIGYTPVGRSSVDATENAGAGNVTLELAGTFRSVWDMALSYTHFIGGTTTQPLADRDFITVSVARTF